MTRQRSFLRAAAALCCLLLLTFGSSRVTRGQKPPQKPGGADEYVIVEGDIQVSPGFYKELAAAARVPLAAPIKFPSTLWPNGIIPFRFETNCATTSGCTGALPSGCVSPANQTAMLNAMTVLEGIANVDFQQCPNNECGGNYVRIRDSSNDAKAGDNNMCESTAADNSTVGMKGGRQDINIFSWRSQPVILHELLHCLGIHHEQSRPDRDQYVRPICENVKGGCDGDDYRVNFTIQSSAAAYGYYDFGSVMHYGQCSHSRNNVCPTPTADFPDGGITMLVREPYDTQWQSRIGQRRGLSDLDRATASFLYPFPGWRFLDTSYDGGKGSPNGTFHRPYTSFAQALADTPEGGTIWLLRSQAVPAAGTYGKPVTVRAAPGVEAVIGG